MRVKHVVAGILAGLLMSGAAHADRLDDIKKKGSLTCATLTTTEPLGFQDPVTRKTVGFDVDMCEAVAKGIGVSLDLKGVAVEARIPELTVGRVDIVAAALGFTKERAEQIDFSDAYYQVPTMLIVRDPALKVPADLGGKKVGANKGSTPEMFTKRVIPTAEIVTYQDGPTAFLALMQGKVQAFAVTQFSGIRFVAQSEGKARFLDQPIGYEGEAIGIPKGETRLVEAVNTVLHQMEASGQLEALWNKWYGPSTRYNLPRAKKVTPISEFK